MRSDFDLVRADVCEMRLEVKSIYKTLSDIQAQLRCVVTPSHAARDVQAQLRCVVTPSHAARDAGTHYPATPHLSTPDEAVPDASSCSSLTPALSRVDESVEAKQQTSFDLLSDSSSSEEKEHVEKHCDHDASARRRRFAVSEKSNRF